MNQKMKILLVGCGRWGKNILRDLKALDCEVIVASDSDIGIQNAKDGNADLIIRSISEVSNIDGAIVAVNTANHFQVINKILEIHGSSLPIFCEKPLCNNVDDAFELAQKAPHNLFLMDKWRYHNGIIELARLAKEEKFGKVKGIKLSRNGWGVPHKDVNCIWILLPHDLTITLEILGYIPEAKFAQIDKTQNGIHGMTGWLSDEKYWISFELNERFIGHKREVIVYFEDGVAQFTDRNEDGIETFLTTRHHLDAKANIQLIKFKNEMPLLSEISSFIKFIKGELGAPKSSAFEGYQVVKKIQELIDIANI